jgi:ring-1,2-phenylacetyl-CoA epoxidase subunit PaaB
VLDARAPEESAASESRPGPEAGSAGREASGGQGAIYEVFRQERKGQPFQHAGSVAAPNERFAEIYAREQYGRRQESVALWLVPREAVKEIGEFPDEFEMKYRRVDGYSIKQRLREAREKAGTLESAPGGNAE